MSHRVAAAVAACAAVLVLALASPAGAQQLELPAPSPKARVDQRVGLTDFQLEYSSPGVKKRSIWGTLVPYGKLWRTGANRATKLTVSRDFMFGNKKVKAGSYALFTIPNKTSWTVILNKNWDTGGTQGYSQKNDVARITVKPTTSAEPRERMLFVFSNTTDDATSLDLEWERMRVRIPIRVDTKTQVASNIEKATGAVWEPHADAADWYLSKGDLDRALSMIDRSIAIQRHWANQWIKAQILDKKGKKAEALAAAQQAQTLGKGNEIYENFFKEDVAKAIQSWR
jgi:Protein of unknown function (DUF2911)